MSYTPIGWQTGDTITADKLNKMDNGWSVSSTQETLCNETVTTAYDSGEELNMGALTYSTPITADVILITFDGIEYECHAMTRRSTTFYGGMTDQGPDFSVYPFVLLSDQESEDYVNMIATETAGTYAVNIRSDGSTIVETADNFAAAVNQCAVPSTYICVSGVTTADDMQAAVNAGRMLIFHPDGNVRSLRFISGFEPNNESIVYYPTDENYARFVNGVFTYFIV